MSKPYACYRGGVNKGRLGDWLDHYLSGTCHISVPWTSGSHQYLSPSDLGEVPWVGEGEERGSNTKFPGKWKKNKHERKTLTVWGRSYDSSPSGYHMKKVFSLTWLYWLCVHAYVCVCMCLYVCVWGGSPFFVLLFLRVACITTHEPIQTSRLWVHVCVCVCRAVNLRSRESGQMHMSDSVIC